MCTCSFAHSSRKRHKPNARRVIEDNILDRARKIMLDRMPRGNLLNSPGVVRDYLTMNLASREHEVFACLFLSSQNQLIQYEELFRGSLNQTSVYPREVVKRGLALNAGAVIFAHNHPSGVAEPSRADDFLTRSLTSALALVDIKVLDHIVVGAGGCVSFAERGLL